jgi:hypothetical protein
MRRRPACQDLAPVTCRVRHPEIPLSAWIYYCPGSQSIHNGERASPGEVEEQGIRCLAGHEAVTSPALGSLTASAREAKIRAHGNHGCHQADQATKSAGCKGRAGAANMGCRRNSQGASRYRDLDLPRASSQHPSPTGLPGRTGSKPALLWFTSAEQDGNTVLAKKRLLWLTSAEQAGNTVKLHVSCTN